VGGAGDGLHQFGSELVLADDLGERIADGVEEFGVVLAHRARRAAQAICDY